MFYTYIYFVDIGSFDGDEMPVPSNNLGVDLDDDQDMADAEDHEAGADRLAPTSASILPFARRGRLDSRLRMELGE